MPNHEGIMPKMDRTSVNIETTESGFDWDKLYAALRFLSAVKPWWSSYSQRSKFMPISVPSEEGRPFGAITAIDKDMVVYIDTSFVRNAPLEQIAGAVEREFRLHTHSVWNRLRDLEEEDWEKWANVCFDMEVSSAIRQEAETLLEIPKALKELKPDSTQVRTFLKSHGISSKRDEEVTIPSSLELRLSAMKGVFSQEDADHWNVKGPPIPPEGWEPSDYGMPEGKSAEEYLQIIKQSEDEDNESDDDDGDSDESEDEEGENSNEESDSEEPDSEEPEENEDEEENDDDPDESEAEEDQGDETEGDGDPEDEEDSESEGGSEDEEDGEDGEGDSDDDLSDDDSEGDGENDFESEDEGTESDESDSEEDGDDGDGGDSDDEAQDSSESGQNESDEESDEDGDSEPESDADGSEEGDSDSEDEEGESKDGDQPSDDPGNGDFEYDENAEQSVAAQIEQDLDDELKGWIAQSLENEDDPLGHQFWKPERDDESFEETSPQDRDDALDDLQDKFDLFTKTAEFSSSDADTSEVSADRKRGRKTDWATRFNQLVRDKSSEVETGGLSDISYLKRNPNQAMVGPILPGMIEHKAVTYGFLDVSFSMRRMFADAVNVFADISEQVFSDAGIKPTWFMGDEKIVSVGDFSNWNEIKKNAFNKEMFNGGTNFVELLELICNGKIEFDGKKYPAPDICVVLTDMQMQFPEIRIASGRCKFIFASILPYVDEAHYNDMGMQVPTFRTVNRFLPKWIDLRSEFVYVGEPL